MSRHPLVSVPCGKCHLCGHSVLVDSFGEWCDRCQVYQHPAQHGWPYPAPFPSPDQMGCERAAQFRLRVGLEGRGIRRPR